MRPIHSNVARVLGMSVTSVAVIYHSPATGSVTGSSLVVVDFVTDETSPTRLPVDCVHHGPVSRTIWTGEDLP